MSVPLAALERPRLGVSNTVFKSGPLFISSKGIGWKSWKKRWFILTRTSLVFFKNDPSALPLKGGEVNLTLGGIDLNNSGSVVVREDKKLLTVLFPDGRDGRAFTLKAESSDDLNEWKSALEHALAQAPCAALVMGHNGIFRNDANDSIEEPFHQWRDKRLIKSMVIRRPILLALEDIDGRPSFLEKALRFLEKHGTKVEGILRLSADVEEVERRVQEYEQGKTEFAFDEDAHVIGDCVKHVLRELPSSPVPASCCTALLDAYRIDRKEARVNAMRSAILETFPEPNRRLLQRVLKMMHVISSHASENRMAPSSVAACMAPLLLRPLLAGECELDDDFDMNTDNSAQLVAAATAANNAQTIITTLLDEYENIFDDDASHRCSISAGSRIENSASEDSTDDENFHVNHNAENDVDLESDDDPERALSGKSSESSCCVATDLYDYKAFNGDDLDIDSQRNNLLSSINTNLYLDSQQIRDSNALFTEEQTKQKRRDENEISVMVNSCISPNGESHRSMGEILASMEPGNVFSGSGPESTSEKLVGSKHITSKRSPFWGKSGTRKSPSLESVDSSGEEELAIQRLEFAKNELRQRIAKEARGNAVLQASLERRKQALHERRLALEQDVARLQEQLEAERDLRAALEVGLSNSGQFSNSRGMDSKTMGELEEIALAEADVARLKQKVAELHQQLNHQRQHQYGSLADPCHRHQQTQFQNSPKNFLPHDFDTNLAYCDNERRIKTESQLEWRNVTGQAFACGTNGTQSTRKQYMDPNLSDSMDAAASTSISMDDSTSMPSNSHRAVEGVDYPRYLGELTTRLNFFKERRSQLMEQLHNLDLNYGSVPSHEFLYKQSSPPWN